MHSARSSDCSSHPSLTLSHTPITQYDLANRGSDYLGVCVTMNQTCTASLNDTFPYNCTSGPGSTALYPAFTPYNMSNAYYRYVAHGPSLWP